MLPSNALGDHPSVGFRSAIAAPAICGKAAGMEKVVGDGATREERAHGERHEVVTIGPYRKLNSILLGFEWQC